MKQQFFVLFFSKTTFVHTVDRQSLINDSTEQQRQWRRQQQIRKEETKIYWKTEFLLLISRKIGYTFVFRPTINNTRQVKIYWAFWIKCSNTNQSCIRWNGIKLLAPKIFAIHTEFPFTWRTFFFFWLINTIFLLRYIFYVI